MGFSMSGMPEKSFQVTKGSRVTWRDFSGMSDMKKSILALSLTGLTFLRYENTKKVQKPLKMECGLSLMLIPRLILDLTIIV